MSRPLARLRRSPKSIAKVINRVAQSRAEFLRNAGNTDNPVLKGKLLNFAAREKLAAVLTIRNRFFRGDVNLSFAIDQVNAVAPEIILFDCLFCRWLKGGKDDAVSLVTRF